MPVDNISTYAVFQSTLNDITKVIGELADAQRQLSSGKRSQDFTGMAVDVQQYLSLDSIQRKTAQYINDNGIVLTRIETTASVLDQVIESSSNLLTLISQRRTNVLNNAAFSLQVDGIWQQLVSQLNTTVDGQYIFSGSKTNLPAVDAENFPQLLQPGVPDAGYYLGSTQDITVRPQENTEFVVNVRADDPGIQKIFAGLSMAVEADEQKNDELFQQAYTFIQDGIKGVINTQATVNARKVEIQNINQTLTFTNLYWKGVQESIGNTDVVAVSTQVAINQGILQAAFQAFAKINSLKLSDFLR